MEVCFVLKGDKFSVRWITKLPAVINKDLCRIPADELKLKTKSDLDHLRSIVKKKKEKKHRDENIREAAEASKLEH